jgi:CPA2 family monovalent cation:H+ antiporter-2
VENALASRPFLRRMVAPRGAAAGADGPPERTGAARHRAVVVGYGPVGQAISTLLEARGIETTIVELNIDTVRRLRGEGRRAVYGDAAQQDILSEAGVATARGLILSSPTSLEAAETIRAAREMNPAIRVLARSSFLSEAPAMRAAGADAVFSGEAEVAMAMIQSVLDDLGTTPEQMDEERERVRRELYRD